MEGSLRNCKRGSGGLGVEGWEIMIPRIYEVSLFRRLVLLLLVATGRCFIQSLETEQQVRKIPNVIELERERRPQFGTLCIHIRHRFFRCCLKMQLGSVIFALFYCPVFKRLGCCSMCVSQLNTRFSTSLCISVNTVLKAKPQSKQTSIVVVWVAFAR